MCCAIHISNSYRFMKFIWEAEDASRVLPDASLWGTPKEMVINHNFCVINVTKKIRLKISLDILCCLAEGGTVHRGRCMGPERDSIEQEVIFIEPY